MADVILGHSPMMSVDVLQYRPSLNSQQVAQFERG